MSEGTETIGKVRDLPPRISRRDGWRPRALLIQGLVLAGLVAFVAYIASNVVANVARLNVHTGFQFLSRPSGMSIPQHLIAYSDASPYIDAFLVALLNTIVLAVVAILLATPVGFLAGFARLSGNRLVRAVAAGYVDIVRNVPLLLQILFWYFAVLSPLPAPRQSLNFLGIAFLNKRGFYLPAPVAEPAAWAFGIACLLGIAGWIVLARLKKPHWMGAGLLVALIAGTVLLWGEPFHWDLPALTGFNFRGGMVVIPEFTAMALALAIYNGAYIAEHVRGGLLSVHPGQREAGLALGLSRWRVATKIVVPQAMRAIVPPLGGQYIQLLKASSLGAAIAYPDLMLVFAGTALNQTGQPLEIMMMTMASYLLLCFGIAGLVNLANRYVRIVER